MARKDYLATHRCEGSLKQMASIRYLPKDVYTRREGWFLHEHVNDFDYFVEYIRKVYPIKYCPFCGLEQPQAQSGEQTDRLR